MGSNTKNVYIDTTNLNHHSSVSHHDDNDNPSSPMEDLCAYSRTMHQHTKKQMEAASRSARRRASQEEDARSYSTEESGSSMASMDSHQS